MRAITLSAIGAVMLTGIVAALIVVLARTDETAVAGHVTDTPTPTLSPTPTPTPTPSPTPTPTPNPGPPCPGAPSPPGGTCPPCPTFNVRTNDVGVFSTCFPLPSPTPTPTPTLRPCVTDPASPIPTDACSPTPSPTPSETPSPTPVPTSYVRGDTDCDQDNDLDDVLASLGDVAGVKPAPCRLNGDYTCDHLLQVYDVLLHFDIRVQIPMQTPDPSATYACFPAMPL